VSLSSGWGRHPSGTGAPPTAPGGTVAAVELSDYQRRSRATAVYPHAGDNLLYPTLGLCGETGEVAEKVKKMVRDDGGVLTADRRAALARELGDVLWYVAQVATEADLDLDAVATENLAKLLSRRERDVLAGSGDDR
jgi:NTP pyrophosphatase (non-canonical NTP hydrolase)